MLTKKFNAEKIIQYILFALSGEAIIVLCAGWMFGNTNLTELDDNFVTALIQKYNYALASLLLVIMIVDLYLKISEEIKSKFVTIKKQMILKIALAILLLELVIMITKVAYSVNLLSICETSTMYILTIFIALAVTLIFEAIVYGCFKLSKAIKCKTELIENIKKYLPIILLTMFLIWTFISCMRAPNIVYDYLSDEAISKINAKPVDVLSRAFNGPGNQKDGLWAFLEYGIIFLSATFIKNKKIKEYLIKIFALSITIISLICVGLKIYSLKIENEYKETCRKSYDRYYDKYLKDSGVDKEAELEKILNNAYVRSKGELEVVYAKKFINIEKGIFKNSNHFGYVLALATIITLSLSVCEKKLWKNILYFLAYSANLYILILNDTFGAYLGALVSIGCLLIYIVIDCIVRHKIKENKISKRILFIILGISLFSVFSLKINKGSGVNIVTDNFKILNKDVETYTEYVEEKSNTNVEVTENLEKQVKTTGSGRGATWSKVGILIKQRPILGYGLECPYYQFLGQFNVDQGRTHNIVLQMLCTVGIPGALMYFTALAIILIRLLKTWKNWEILEILCVFAGIEYMFTSLTGNSTYYTSPYFVLILGLAFVINEKTVKHSKSIVKY